MSPCCPALFPTACKTCRRRGRRCDRTLPTCLSCRCKGIVCEGYVTRWVGVAARGPLAGKTCPVASSPPGSNGTELSRKRNPSKKSTGAAMQSPATIGHAKGTAGSPVPPCGELKMDGSCLSYGYKSSWKHIEDSSPRPSIGPSLNDRDMELLIEYCMTDTRVLEYQQTRS